MPSWTLTSCNIWQHLTCISHVTNYHRVSRGADTVCNVLCSTGNPDKQWPTAHQSECGLPSSAGLPGITTESGIVLVHPVSYSTFTGCPFNLPTPMYIDHHYSGTGKQPYIFPLHFWLIRSTCSIWSFHLICISPGTHK